MAILDDHTLIQEPTVPDNLDQPPKFGAISETLKDAILLELRHFLSTDKAKLRTSELPRVEKYSVAADVSVDPLETAVSLIRSYPDITEDMPLIAVMSTTGRNMKLGLSDKYIATVVNPATVVGSVAGPTYTLSEGMDIVVTTVPTADLNNIVTSTFVMRSFMFVDITNATLQEIINAINTQALYVSAFTYENGGNIYLGLSAGGTHGLNFPNKITVVSGTLLPAVGLTAAQTSQNYGAGKVAYERHAISAELTVALEVMAESENVRTDVTDLLYDFLAYVMADKKFQLYGRSVFDSSVTNETYQIILKDADIYLAGEQEIPRSNDQRDKIYINRMSIPVVIIQYSDRVITNNDNSILIPQISHDVTRIDDLPMPN